MKTAAARACGFAALRGQSDGVVSRENKTRHIRPASKRKSGRYPGSSSLGGSRGYSGKEVIAVAETVCGCTTPSETAARRPGDPMGMPRPMLK